MSEYRRVRLVHIGHTAAAGKTIGAFGLTEPDAGSDPGGMLTRAKTTPSGDFVLSGSKTWISNAPVRPQPRCHGMVDLRCRVLNRGDVIVLHSRSATNHNPTGE